MPTVDLDAPALLDHLPYRVGVFEAIRDDRGQVVDFQIAHLNEVACRDAGVPPEQLVGKPVRVLFPEQQEAFRQVVDTGQPVDTVFDGAPELHVEKHGDGVVVCWKRDESERYRDLYENAPDLLCSVDAATGLVTECNRTFLEKTGFELTEVVGHPVLERYATESLEAGRAWLERFREAGEIHDAELRLRRHDGSALDVSLEARGSRWAFRDITAHKRDDDALRESLAQLRFALEATRVGKWDLDLATRTLRHDLLFQPGAGQRVYGLENFLAEVVHPDDAARVGNSLQHALDEGIEWECEFRILLSDDAVQWLWIKGDVTAFDEAGPRCMAGLAMDITEHKLARQLIEEQHAQLQAVYDAMSDGLIVFDATGRPVLMNQAEARMKGFADAGELRSQLAAFHDLFVLTNPDGSPVPPEQWPEARVLRGERISGEELCVRRQSTNQEWLVSISGEPVRDRAGEPILAVIISRDITEQKRAELILRESEERFRTLADHISQLAWMADPDGCITWYNKRWYDFTGTTPDQMAEWGWKWIVHPDHVDRVAAHMARSMDRGDAFEDTFLMRAHDGSYRWFLTRAEPIRDEQGQVARWLGTNTDITEQREADRRKDEFLATLAHELRNPLAPIRYAVQVLRRAEAHQETLERAREMIDRQIRHMVRLIDDLLDVSRITRGKLELRREPVDLATVVDLALETSRPHIEKEAQHLTVSLPSEPLPLLADAVRLAQVFANLLNNASKYTERDGHITLSAERDDDHVVVRVQDTGIGIPADELPRLFDLFAQVDSRTNRAHGGLGIGLSLARGLVQMHDGEIEACSAGPGRGSTFVVRLPVYHGPGADQDRSVDTAPGATGRHILVVDDNRDSADTLGMLLALHGNRVEVAHGGRQALELAERARPEVILLDLGMPELDGYEVCRRIREQPWGRLIVIVALTGWGSETDRARTSEAGFDAHLVKPVDPEALLCTLGELS